VTFVSQYQVRPPSETRLADQSATPAAPAELFFPEPSKKWDFSAESELETGSPGHYDFRFENRNQVPINIGLKSVSCKCTGVSVCVLTPEEMRRYLLWAHELPAFEAAMAHSGILATLAQIAAEEQATQALEGLKLDWVAEIKPGDARAKEPDQVIATVPPKAGGLIRINFKDKSHATGEILLAIDLWTQPGEGSNTQRSTPRLEYKYKRVGPFGYAPATADLGDFNPGDEKSHDFLALSSVNAQFPLKVYEKNHDPCFICTCTPLSGQELNLLSHSSKGEVRAYSGYRIHVDVKEKVSDQVQMDLGPFQRRIVLESEEGDAGAGILISGNVRGDIVVGAPEDEGKIKLGSFSSGIGTRKVVHLTTLQSGMELKVARIEPETLNYVHVKRLKKAKSVGDSKSIWEMAVEIPPGCPPGAFPSHSAIILDITGDPPRHVRIPINGRAFQ
jgi:hypothetical protein